MRQRVIDLLGTQGRGVWVSTFHSFCARVLRLHADALGYKKTFSIYDESESMALLKRIYKTGGIPDTQPSVGVTQAKISHAKDKLITPKDFAADAADFLDHNVAIVYDEYQKRLLQNQAFDFDDLLMKTVELYQNHPDILSYYQNRFRHILVDEFQDTNHAQYVLVNLLAQRSRNLCVVGDDDQSIYAWRGADISNILDFEKDYADCKIIKLEQNYRSTQIVLDAAWQVVSKNEDRMPKKLFTRKTGGEKITLLLCGDELDEAEAIVEKIRLGLIYDKSPSEFAILYRTNAQSRVIEDALRHKGLPYTIVGGIRFYERAEVKDIVAYLRLLINPDDNMALLRVINIPRRGIGKTTVVKLEELAAKNGISIMSVLSKSLEDIGIKGKARLELDKLLALLHNLSSRLDELEPQDIAARLIEGVRYLDMLEAEGTPEADVRADNVREVVAGIEEYCQRTEAPTLAGFIEEVALITDVDTWDASSQSVTLMTLHSAKGLEFDTVFLAGMEDGLFPLSRSFDDKSDLEEERRLCYVGMTRAKNKLYLSMAGFRRRWGDYTGGPSMFLKDIPQDLLETEKLNYWYDKAAPQPKRLQLAESGKSENEQAELDDMLTIGTDVMHEKFGRGTVIAREGSGENLIVTIRFQSAGAKKIMVKYASLEILGR
jgi:DNA helicase-2/ATP-dependent DNA helicase PcrA